VLLDQLLALPALDHHAPEHQALAVDGGRRRGDAQDAVKGEDEEDAQWARLSSDYKFPHEDDAFHTIIRWLHSRMKDIQSGKA
jgi:hypothetical protein